MALGCQRNDCIYNNKDGECFAKTIAIKGRNAKTTASTTCDSFVSEEGLQIYEFANEFMDNDKWPSDTKNIKCAARNCRYNVDKACMAEKVEINYENASCETFEL